MDKAKLKRYFIPLLISKPLSMVASSLLGYGIPIFTLHRTYPDGSNIAGHTPSFLRKCLEYLKKNGYKFVSVEEIILYLRSNNTIPNKWVSFTIDDGFSDQSSLAAPVFLEYDCPVTIFLITDFVDGKLWPWYSKVEYIINNSNVSSLEFSHNSINTKFSLHTTKHKTKARHVIQESMKKFSWDLIPDVLRDLEEKAQLPLPTIAPEPYKAMSWDTARALESAGIRFGPHTVTHPIMSMVNDEQSEFEITQSWNQLNNELNAASPVFCYPNGKPSNYGKREINIIKNIGLVGAVSTVPAQIKTKPTDDLFYNLPRYSLPVNFDEFVMYCSWVEYLKEKIRKI